MLIYLKCCQNPLTSSCKYIRSNGFHIANLFYLYSFNWIETVLILMIWEIIIFMILFIIVLIIYSSIGTLLFYTVASYQDFWTTFITLFSAALGNFDFTVLTSQPKGQLIGDLYLISFLILTAILFLNLLVAILTKVYQNFESKKFVLYISEILKLRSLLGYDKKASGLISIPPPLNLLPLIMSPLYFTRLNQAKLNTLVLHVCYIPVLLITTLIFIVFNLFILPFAFFKGIAVKVQFLFYRKSKIKMNKRILSLLVFILFGILILLLNLCVDMVYFFKHMYQNELNCISKKIKTKQILLNSFNIIEKKIENDIDEGAEVINTSEFSQFLRNENCVFDKIQKVIYGDFQNIVDAKVYMNQIKDYSLLKRILASGSIYFESKKIIILSIWRSILKELKSNSIIRQIMNHKNTNNNKKRSKNIIIPTESTKNSEVNSSILQISQISNSSIMKPLPLKLNLKSQIHIQEENINNPHQNSPLLSSPRISSARFANIENCPSFRSPNSITAMYFPPINKGD